MLGQECRARVHDPQSLAGDILKNIKEVGRGVHKINRISCAKKKGIIYHNVPIVLSIDNGMFLHR